MAVLCDEPTRALREEQDEADLEERGADLEVGGDAPGPVALDGVGAEADSRGEDLPDEVRDIEEGGEAGAFLGVAELAEEGGGVDDGKGDAWRATR